jgi:hypothetical protein
MAAGNAVSCATGDKEGAGVRRQETSRGMEAGRRTGPRRRVAVPAPEEKQGLRGEPDDGVAADRVACPAGGEQHVAEDYGGGALLSSRGAYDPTDRGLLILVERSSAGDSAAAAA